MNLKRALKIKGWMKPAQLRWLATQAKRCKNIIEVGTYRGRSARAMLDNSTAKLICVDSWDHIWRGIRIGSKDMRIFLDNIKDVRERVSIYQMDSHEAAILIGQTIGVGFADMVFIDGGHDYKTVKQDIRDYRMLLRPGGLLCGDDYHSHWKGVMRAVDEVVSGFNVFGTIWFTEV